MDWLRFLARRKDPGARAEGERRRLASMLARPDRRLRDLERQLEATLAACGPLPSGRLREIHDDASLGLAVVYLHYARQFCALEVDEIVAPSWTGFATKARAYAQQVLAADLGTMVDAVATLADEARAVTPDDASARGRLQCLRRAQAPESALVSDLAPVRGGWTLAEMYAQRELGQRRVRDVLAFLDVLPGADTWRRRLADS